MEQAAYKAGQEAAKRGFIGEVWCQYHATHKALREAWIKGNKGN